MAQPLIRDLVIYGGSNGVPTTATDPIGGSVLTTTALSSASLGGDLGTIGRGSSDLTYYAIIYFQNNCASPSYLNFARVYNRSGAINNSVAGTLSYVSNSSSDTSTILTTGKVGNAFHQELITLTGTTPVSGSAIWDVSSVIRHESLAASIAPVKLTGNVTISSSGQIIAVIYGTLVNPPTLDFSTYTASAEFTFALATAKSTVLSSANRLTPPTGIGSFAPATFWGGGDASLGVPSATLIGGEYIGVCIAYQSLTGAPESVSNEIDHFPIILGTPYS